MESEIIETQVVETEEEFIFTAEASNVPEIISNYVVFKERLLVEVGKYKISVTEDNVSKAKKMMASLNKIKKSIKDKEKQVRILFNKPIEDLGDKIEELEKICDNSRSEISIQVDKFEDATKAECLKLVVKLIADLRGDYKIRNEFFNSEYQDLVKLTAITAKGGLVKATKELIDYRIKKEQMNQLLHDGRIDESFKECTQAGIEPFTTASISHLLQLDQDIFRSKLRVMIDAELERNKKIKLQAEEKAKVELKQQVQDEEREVIRKEEQVKANIKVEEKKIEDRIIDAIQEKDGFIVVTDFKVKNDMKLGQPKTSVIAKEPEKTNKTKIRPSSIDRILRCSASITSPEITINDDGYSSQGTENHSAIEAIIKGTFDENNFSTDAQISAFVVRKFLNKFPTAELVATELKLEMDLNGIVFKGTADAVFIIDGCPVVIDWKTGYLVKDAKNQTSSYILLLSQLDEFKKFDKFKGVTFNTKSQEYFVHEMNRADIAEFRGEILEKLNSHKVYNVQIDTCEYCPRLLECPAYRLSTQVAIENFNNTNLLDEIESGVKNVLDSYEQYRMLEKAMKRFEVLLKIGAENNLENDKYKAYNTIIEKREFIAIKTIPLLSEKYGNVQSLKEDLRLTKSAIDEFVGERAKDKEKGKDQKEVMDLLEKNDAVIKNPYKKICVERK